MARNDSDADSAANDQSPDRVKFDFIKSNHFRVVHADGVWGGVTPTLDIHMDVWSHRAAIPRAVVHQVKPDGTLGAESEDARETRDAIVREVEVGITLNLALAKAMVTWLEDKIAFIEDQKAAQQEDREVPQ